MNKMARIYLIKWNGYYIERFYKKSIAVTEDIKRAGRYAWGEAQEQIVKKGIQAEIVKE